MSIKDRQKFEHNPPRPTYKQLLLLLKLFSPHFFTVGKTRIEVGKRGKDVGKRGRDVRKRGGKRRMEVGRERYRGGEERDIIYIERERGGKERGKRGRGREVRINRLETRREGKRRRRHCFSFHPLFSVKAAITNPPPLVHSPVSWMMWTMDPGRDSIIYRQVADPNEGMRM